MGLTARPFRREGGGAGCAKRSTFFVSSDPKPRTTRVTRAAGFRLVVRPTVFHPRWFITSEFFAYFMGRLDLSGKRVADVGTGSGILALAAARAGAAHVTAVDVNPKAALTAGGQTAMAITSWLYAQTFCLRSPRRIV
jgi:methylase of polypeptide subunit release factors